jgi:hypothetical protein
MDRNPSIPDSIRRDGKEAPFAADEVIFENDPLSEGEESWGIDEVIDEEPASQTPETS